MQQRTSFLKDEGDAYFRRNPATREELATRCDKDPLLAACGELDLAPRRILEVGASNGWRLAGFAARHPGASLCGVDPSRAAVEDGNARFPGLELVQGTADALAFEDGRFDLVVVGFCLYLCDRADLFRIAAEVDRVLADGGHVALYDFHVSRPYRRPYTHAQGLASYKMDYTRLFTWNPAYTTRQQRVFSHPGGAGGEDDQVAVSVLAKALHSAWPQGPLEAPGAEAGA